ncbi:MAG: hypothetical protein IIU97_05155, partial [Bacteroidaceae bacterium]|nr:hypothetical protein [Bacteroidaceae bacterium]
CAPELLVFGQTHWSAPTFSGYTRNLKKRFFVTLRMTKLSFVIGEFISGWSHEAWMKIMPCGSLRNERANDIANIE